VVNGLCFAFPTTSSQSKKLSGDSSYLFRNHLVRAGFGVVMIFLFARIDYQHLIKFRRVLFFIAAGLYSIFDAGSNPPKALLGG
jgi:cell division protein FtsW (lipid II flippase)